MPKPTKIDRSVMLGRHLRSLELGKKRYAQADAAMSELLKETKPGDIVKTPSGKKFRLMDLHKQAREHGKKKVCIAICREFEFEEVTEP